MIEHSIEAPIAGDVGPETAEAGTADAPAVEPSNEAPATFETLTTEPHSDPAAFARGTSERDAWVRRYFESRQGLSGESRAGTESGLVPLEESRADAEEQKRRANEKKP